MGLGNNLPDNYESWKRCITISCGISLTTSYINNRLAELRDKNNKSTQRFIALYGDGHYQTVIEWFERSLEEFIEYKIGVCSSIVRS